MPSIVDFRTISRMEDCRFNKFHVLSPSMYEYYFSLNVTSHGLDFVEFK
jgi:hypothetical protein